jgi:serine/threonine protein phosphatase 1
MERSTHDLSISDIHGNLSQLIRRMEQLEKIASFSSGKDMLIFLGDYINRGEHSYQVLEYVRNLSSRSQGNIVSIEGNHEDAFLDFIDGWMYG